MADEKSKRAKQAPIKDFTVGVNPNTKKLDKRVRYDWATIRAEFEAGATRRQLVEKYGCSPTALAKRELAEGWKQDLEAAIQKRTVEKVAKLEGTADPKKRAAAVDDEAQRRADVVSRHRTEWDVHAGLLDEVFERRDFNLAKLVKITAETLKIRQEGERKAWNLDNPVQQVNVTNSNIRNPQDLTDDELAAIIASGCGA